MPTEITLYYADWCGHCTRFKPEWEALKNSLDQLDIGHNEYEESKNKKTVQDAGVEGFPTIRIKRDGTEYDYVGPRTAPDLLQELGISPQSGGANGEMPDFNEKYLKYKSKYGSLRKWMDNYKKTHGN